MENKARKYTAGKFSDQNTTTAAASPTAQSHTVGANVFAVRIATLGAIHVAFGRDATSSDLIMQDGETEYFSVSPGMTVSVIQNGANTADFSVTDSP